MSKQPLVIKTERDGILLRQLLRTDAQTLFDVIDRNREHLRMWSHGEKFPDVEYVRRNISEDICSLQLGIWKQSALVGGIELWMEHEPHHAGIGFWLTQECVGQGYITASLRALITHAFDVVEYFHLVANVSEENVRSRKLLSQFGFHGSEAKDGWMNYTLRAYEWSS